ncbi:MAG: multidrug ABC transporter substrate-binding protein [Alphaproteobacteria bacterium]|nr:MAG: multidrug ABC transporter substrate-binding protein [Alphaproteobacteria bacterium]
MIAETIRQALKAILRNALRSFLTILGIIIGVAAVIAMVTLGQGSTTQVEADVASMGANLLMVRPGRMMGPGGSSRTASPFTMRDVEAIEAQVPGVTVAAPTSVNQMTVIFGNTNHPTSVTGTDNRYLAARDWSLAAGREFLDSELRAGSAACILGSTARRELFGATDPLGETVRMARISCRVIGVLEAKGASSFGQDQDDVVLMPLRAFQRRIAGNQDVNLIHVAIGAGLSTEKAKADIEQLMRERRRVRPGENDDFTVMDMKELASMLTGITTVMTGMLSAVAAVSLLVGGIGIMNIMLVSVTERTREIGIRLAIGATEGQVLMQFLVEAIVLSLFGGLIGIGAGLSLAAIGTRYLAVPFEPDLSVIVIAFGFSAMIGIVFGFFPARRAARLDPIEALRHE